MKLKTYIIILLLIFFFGIISTFYISSIPVDNELDTVTVNDIVSDIKSGWKLIGNSDYPLPGLTYGIDYAVLDRKGALLAATRRGLSENENSAVRHRDTIITLMDAEGTILGKVLFYNDSNKHWEKFRCTLLTTFLLMSTLVIITSSIMLFLLHQKILKPFQTLKNFALNVAGGKLDIPLPMDKDNVFGAFSESFDLMRTQLATAQENERKANISKKELVASLSHDIKTPVASIKAISELMYLNASDSKAKLQLDTINAKADQINLLITNMFHATLEELKELKVTPAELFSHAIADMIHNADYRHLTETGTIPDCLIMADSLRLAQVFDNLISNSYKYADTRIHISFSLTDCFIIRIADYGPGVLPEELPLLKQKYYRGKNAINQQGSGIGLYISQYFMEKMQGSLQCRNTDSGFMIQLTLPLA
jgi:signal transduction histidine kinase